MANSIEKLLQDIRSAKGLAPDPMANAVQPATILPSEIVAPELPPAPIDQALAGVGEVPQTDMAGLIDQAIPMPTEAPPPPQVANGALGMPGMESAGISQTSSSGGQAADTLAKYKKYETGTGDILAADMAAIDAAKNPEATAGQLNATDAQDTMAGVVSNQADIAALAEQQAAEESVILQQEAGQVEEYQQDVEHAYQEGLNRIDEIDREVAELASREPDPGRYWSTRTAGQKAAYLLVAALQAFSKPEEVPKVVDMVTKFIDDDVRIQEDRMGRELAAAQGRGKSVREIISMGKEKDAAIYGQKMLAVQGLEKALASKMRGLGAGPAAEAQILAAKQVTDAATARYRDGAAEGARKNAEVEAKRLEGARQRAHESAMLRARIQADKDSEDRAAKAKAASAEGPATLPFQNTEVFVVGPDGKEMPLKNEDGSAVDSIPLNGAAPTALVTEVLKKASAQAALARASADMYEMLERKSKVSDLLMDKEYIDLAGEYAVTMRNAKEVGVMTENDRKEAMRKVGLTIAPDGIGFTTVGDLKVSPETVRTVVTRHDSDAASMMERDLYGITAQQPGRKLVVRPMSGVDVLRKRQGAKAKSDEAAATDRGMTMAGMSRGQGLDYEKSYKEASKLLPLGSGKTPAELQMQAVAKDGRSSAATGETRSALYAAKETLEAAAAKAKSKPEKLDLMLRTKRAEAGIYVIENTPQDRTPEQHAKDLRRMADAAKIEPGRSRKFTGSAMYTKEQAAAIKLEADKYETALKLATGTVRKE